MAEASRPDFRYVIAAALLGFVLGVFVAASLGRLTISRPQEPARTSLPGSLDDDAHVVAQQTTAAPQPQARTPAPLHAAGTIGVTPSTAGDARALADRHLTIPVQGVPAEKLVDSFTSPRTGHEHEAIDILAPRNTPVVAVEDGTIAKLFLSKAGGNTIYQFDPSTEYCYYYAHLERYAEGLKEGDHVSRGQVIGYVGTSGDAPKNTPHLHFAIYRLTPEKHWWQGSAIDPYPVLR